MNATYGSWGQSAPTSWEFAPGVTVEKKKRMGQGISADQWAELGYATGALTSGVASLVHGGRQIPVDVPPSYTDPSQPPPPTQAPMPTGMVLLGVGGLVMLGLLGLAATTGKRR
jgi:hypothetical protein